MVTVSINGRFSVHSGFVKGWWITKALLYLSPTQVACASTATA